MQLVYLFLLCTAATLNAMHTNQESAFNKSPFIVAKEHIEHCIAYDITSTAKPLLTRYGSQLSQKEKDKYLISCYARPGMAPLILKLGADANVHFHCNCTSCALSGLPNSCKKESILHVAAARGNPGVVKALLDYNAYVNARDEKQETPLMKACRIHAINASRGDKRYIGDYMYTIEYLIEAKADRNLINQEGKTALQIAQTEIEDPKGREIIVNSLACQKIK